MHLDPDPSIWDYLLTLPERRRLARLQAEEAAANASGALDEALPGKPSAVACQEGGAEPQQSRLGQRISWQSWVFLAGLLVYLLTRFIRIEDFPIYFFCDEAIQTMSIFNLLKNGLRDPAGNFLPAYFQNGGQFNLGFSVYWQLIPALLPRSAALTRGFAAALTLVFPLSLGLALKDIFKSKTWWLAPLLVSVIPAWFLHSRTAFETCIGASMYALFIYFYLKYRLQARQFLYPALFFGALAFYSYSPLQMVMLVSGLLLLLIDMRYHLLDKWTFLGGVLLLLLLAAPDLRFRYIYQEAVKQHLNLLHSYLLEPSLNSLQKLFEFLKRYLQGFDPSYWFFFNRRDLIRHLMLNRGHLPTLFLPLFGLGLWQSIKGLKQPQNRVVLAAFLAAPTGAALVDPSITRLMVMIVPMAYLCSLGLDWLLARLPIAQQNLKLATAATAGLLLLSASWMSFDAIQNGPTWFEDYTLYGMQWGGKQVFGEIREILNEKPETEVILTPSWANNTDIVGSFFLGDPLPLSFRSVRSYVEKELPISPQTLFILTPEEYDYLQLSGKFEAPEVQKILNWPNGKPGFYFLKLNYVENVSVIFEAERVELSKPMQDTVHILSQEVPVEFSRIDMAKIWAAFDGDERTLTRSFEANPFNIKLDFPQPAHISGVTVTVGAPPTRVEVEITRADGSQAKFFAETLEESKTIRDIGVQFGQTLEVKTARISVLSLDEAEPTHVHIWDIRFAE